MREREKKRERDREENNELVGILDAHSKPAAHALMTMLIKGDCVNV